MSRRTKTFEIAPWIGGINTSVDAGILNPQELVQADNVQFSATGARIKRNALEYLLNTLEAPDFRSSSGTTRTLKWTTTTLVATASPDERLVVGEKINVAGNASYDVTDGEVLSVTSIPQVTSIICVADVAGSLAGKYFLIPAGDSGVNYYVWFKVSGSGSDPALSGKTGVEVDISTNDSAGTVATAVATALDALAAFVATPSSAIVTCTNALGGLTTDGEAGDSGFTVSVTTKGGHSITYTAGSSLSESSTAAALTIERASKVIMVHDYWRYAAGSNTQLLVYATDNFQLFKVDSSKRRVQIQGQGQTTQIVCQAASTLTTGDYFLLNGPNNVTNYYVWYNKATGGGDPAVANRTGIEVAVGGGDTNAQVATATKNAIDAQAAFTATVDTATVTAIAVDAGVTDEAIDTNTGFAITTTAYGATAPTVAVSTVQPIVFNERLQLRFSGIGNYPIVYNPDENAKYQLLNANTSVGLDGPDASFAFKFLGRIWCNDKTERDRIHYCETFDETLWLGFGDSGALDVSPGDGDPEGITNGYVYKGFAVIGKKNSRHRIQGDSPENFFVEEISQGMGNEGPLAIPVDESDVVFVSKRGIHSQAATDRYGDTDARYLSSDIKPTFNSWESEDLKLMQGTYIPELNSIALSVSEEGKTSQNAVWLYNIEIQVQGKDESGVWYRWPDISCTALARRFADGKYKLVFGTDDGRLIQAQKENDFADFGVDGIPFRIKTGSIYPGQDLNSVKAFKKITMIYRPKGNFSFTVQAKIDNQLTQSFSYNQISGLDLLGDTFVLGNSLLGSSNTLAPFTFTMEGYGRGVTLTITQPSADEQVEVWGFIIEYEYADLQQEVED